KKAAPPAKRPPKPTNAPKASPPADAAPMTATERQYQRARNRFAKDLDKRIAREPALADRLRQHKDQVLGWYAQAGGIVAIRFHCDDPRTACKVCSGRHNKEYDLLTPEVVARVLPPSHDADDSRHACLCTAVPVAAGQPTAMPSAK
ncbi:MAG: hypothetical protein KGR26_12925, partial [Cyanobacteria bacterium REEB65]|nr:hypothetical protein [Cyanobacteria bacterium REEB65]